MNGKYDDIINLPHYVSRTRSHMSQKDRAAQFSSFAALTGHKEAIKETARLTDAQIELDDNEKAIIDTRLRIISECITYKPLISIIYFEPDGKKSGGKYITYQGNVKKIDDYEQTVIMTNGTKIPFNSIIDINSDLFAAYF